MFNNPKDIPFAAGGVWALYYLVLIIPTLPRPRWQLVLKLGLACGLTLGVRVGGLLLLAYLGLLLSLFALWRALETRRVGVLFREGIVSGFRVFLPVVADRLSGDADLLAVGAARTDRQSALGARDLLAPGIPVPHAFAGHYVPAPICPGPICRCISCWRCRSSCCCCWSPSPFIALFAAVAQTSARSAATAS